MSQSTKLRDPNASIDDEIYIVDNIRYAHTSEARVNKVYNKILGIDPDQVKQEPFQWLSVRRIEGFLNEYHLLDEVFAFDIGTTKSDLPLVAFSLIIPISGVYDRLRQEQRDTTRRTRNHLVDVLNKSFTHAEACRGRYDYEVLLCAAA